MEKIVLTVMCMIYNDEEVLMINRCNDWPGFTFPGGHVEYKEPIVSAIIREIKEETGLEIFDIKLIGIREWYDADSDIRNVGILFKTNKYKGNIISTSCEGDIAWVKIKDLNNIKLCEGFKLELPLFLENNGIEIFSSYIDKENKYKFF